MIVQNDLAASVISKFQSKTEKYFKFYAFI